MGTAADTATLGAALIQKYSQPMYYEAPYAKNPTLEMIKRRTDFNGDNKVVVLRYATTQGMSPTFSDAQAGASPSALARVTVTHSRNFASAFIDGELLSRASSLKDSLYLASREIDSTMAQLVRGMGIGLFRNNGGAFARATFSGTTATLVDDNGNAAIWLTDNFEKGQRIQISANDGSSSSHSLKASGAFVTLTAISRQAGTLTADANWSTLSAASNDYLFLKGWFQKNMYGFPAWNPSTAPINGENFFGLDRSQDDRLFGFWVSGQGAPYKETIIESLVTLAKNGAETDLVTVNPLDWGNMVKAEQSHVIYDRVKSMNNPDIGFQSFKIIGPKGAVDVIADQNCPRGRFHALQLDTWSFDSSGPAPKILNEDGLGPLVRVYNANQYETRLGWYGQPICVAPGLNGGGTF
jgi:hypothetical protein